MSKTRWHLEKASLNHSAESIPVPVVHDAAIANAMTLGGRLIPMLFLDTAARPDVRALFEAHRLLQTTGEVATVWGKWDNSDRVNLLLILKFKRPVVCTVVLEFDLRKYGGLLDHIITAQAVWLTWGNVGDNFLSAQDRPKVLVEVPSSEFREEWDQLLDSALQADAKASGLSRQQAKAASKALREEWRKMSRPFRG